MLARLQREKDSNSLPRHALQPQAGQQRIRFAKPATLTTPLASGPIWHVLENVVTNDLAIAGTRGSS
jgi:hypothetical protein